MPDTNVNFAPPPETLTTDERLANTDLAISFLLADAVTPRKPTKIIALS